MARRGDSRERMVNSAITLLRERGVSGVTVDAVLAHSGAPRGSVYHHFPGGRDELILTALRQAGDYITASILKSVETGDPLQVLDKFAAFWLKSLKATAYQSGCPVLAMAVDTREDLPEAGELVREIFAAWLSAFTDLLEATGKPRARALATLTVASIEGAIVLCRVQQSPIPLEDAVGELKTLLA